MESSYIIVNGVRMTEKEFKAYKAQRRPIQKSVRKTHKPKAKSVIYDVLEDIMNKLSVCKSIVAYRSHGYRQWGNIAKDILEDKDINPKLFKVVTLTKDAEALMTEIKPMAKRSSKCVWQYIDMLKWKIQDIKDALQALLDGIHKSKILFYYPNHECIYGEGRRLGLQTLCIKSARAIRNIDTYITDIEKLR